MIEHTNTIEVDVVITLYITIILNKLLLLPLFKGLYNTSERK